MTISKTAIITLALTGLMGCSGGGGGGGSATPAPSLPPASVPPASPPPASPPPASGGVLVADPGGPYSGGEGQTVDFDGSGSVSPGGVITSYAWAFSDGGSATGPSPSRVFADDGAFTARLTVTDSLGRTATTTANVSVANLPPSADAGGPYSGVPGTPVSFQGQGADPGASDTLTFLWDFGDGSSGSGASVSHSYAVAGAFTATLTVRDDAGASTTDSAPVAIDVPVAADAARIIFPTSGAPCESQTAELTITGAAESPDGVREVRVNGQVATLAPISAQRVKWRTKVQLQRGANTISVDMVTDAGATRLGLAATTVQFEPSRGEFSGLALDPAARKLYIADASLDTIFVLDLASFQRSVLSSPAVGAGPVLDDPRGVAIDAANNRLLVADRALGAVLTIDLASGDRGVLSSSAVGAGPALARPRKVTIAAGSAYATVDGALLSIDLASGDRGLISGPNVGAGPALQNPQGLALDPTNNRAFVADLAARAVLEVDLASGDRSVIADAVTGSGFAVDTPSDLALDLAGDRLFVLDPAAEAIYAIRLASRDRQGVTGPNIGRPFLPMHTPTGLVFEAGAGKFYVTQAEAIRPGTNIFLNPQLLSVDQLSGDRTGVTGLINDGPSLFAEGLVGLTFEAAATYDRANDQIYVVDNLTPAIRRIDLATGNRTTVSAADRGNGPMFSLPAGVELDAANNRMLLTDLLLERIFAIDLASGDRTEFSGPNVGAGAALNRVETITLDAARNRLIAYDSAPFVSSFIAVDLASGDRSLIADTRGQLEVLVAAETFLDTPRNRLLILDRNRSSGGFLTMDLATNQRQDLLLSGSPRTPIKLVAMAPDLDNNRVFIFDDQSRSVFSFNPQIGFADELSLNGGFLGSTGVFVESGYELMLSSDGADRLLLLAVTLRSDVPPNPIAYTPGAYTIIALSLVAIDPVSGDRVILSE